MSGHTSPGDGGMTLDRRRFLTAAAGAAGASAVAGCTAPTRQDDDRPPNIVLLMADDLGWECLEPYGSEQYHTPYLNYLASQGMRFTRAYSQPLCTPSRVKLMTGKSNIRNYLAFGLLDPRERTVAHVLSDAGYATAIAGKWQLHGSKALPGSLQRSGMHPLDSGFDEYCLWHVWRTSKRYYNPEVLVRTPGQFEVGEYGPDVFADFLLDFVERHRDRPFFAYYPMVLPHQPLHTPPGIDRTMYTAQERYEAMVTYIDRIVGRVARRLEHLDLTRDTLILFTGDNGSPQAIRSTVGGRKIEGGKRRTIDAGIHVPLVARMPGTVPRGTACGDLVSFSDILPTLADLGGASLPAGPIDGRSFAPQLHGRTGTPREWAFCWYRQGKFPGDGEQKTTRFVWDEEWKLYDDGRLYQYTVDPRENRPTEPDDDSPAERMARRPLRAALASMPSTWQAADRYEALEA